MTLKVTVLGSSGTYPTTDRATSGYLLDDGEANVWLDAGCGTFRNLQRVGDYKKLDAVVLSHRHPDHTVDVFLAFHARMYGPESPLDPIPLFAPADTLERITAFADNLSDSFALTEIDDRSEIEIGAMHLAFTRMVHPPVTLGARVTVNGSSLAFTADSGVGDGGCEHFERLGKGVDLLVAEATLQEIDEPWADGHLRASDAGDIARRLGVGRLLLTHLPPERPLQNSLEQAEAAAGGIAIALATDAMSIEL